MTNIEFNKLAKQYKNFVKGYLGKRFHYLNSHTREDIEQQVWLSLSKIKSSDIIIEPTIHGLLATICHRRVADYLRMGYESHYMTCDSGFWDANVESYDDDIELDEIDFVQNALKHTTPQMIQCATLVLVDGHTMRATAERLGVPIGSVLSATYRSKKHIRKQFEELYK